MGINEQIKQIFDDKLKAAYAISFIAVGALTYILLVKGDYGELKRITDKAAELDMSARVLSQTVDYKAYMKEIRKACATGQNSNWLADTITGISRDDSVVLVSLKPVPAVDMGGYMIVRVSADGKASIKDFLRFTSHIENFDKRLFIESCEITAERKGGWPQPAQISSYPGLPASAMEISAPRVEENVIFKLGIASIMAGNE